MSTSDQRRPFDQKKALGKGLHSLLPTRGTYQPQAGPGPVPAPEVAADGNVSFAEIKSVTPNPNQPRREFEQDALLELAQSIEREGIIQPIIVRRAASGEFQIIAGERRWRAASIAGLTQVPVIVREADDHKVLELAIVENIQREDLNPIELAQAFERMAADLSLSHEEIGQKTGKDRVTVTNSIRLLQLPVPVQELVSARKITPGHARALLKLPTEKTQQELAERCIAEGWSVRQIEEYTKPPKEAGDEIVPRKAAVAAKPADPNVKAAIAELERVLGSRVRIMEKGKGKGLIEIEYYSDEDLDRVYGLIIGQASGDPAML